MIVSLLPSRVTVTGTTNLPPSLAITPTVTSSLACNSSPFTLTLFFTKVSSSGVNLSPATGSFEIGTGWVESVTVNLNGSDFLVTSTLIVSLLPSRVTVTETTVLSCSCVTFPNSTLSPSFNDSPLTSKFSLIFSLSSSFKSSPTVGVFGISIGFAGSFTPTVNTWSFLTTGTSIISFDPSSYVTSTSTTFVPGVLPSLIAPSFRISFLAGCGCPSGTVTASLIAVLSASLSTFVAVFGSTEISTAPPVTVGVACSALVL